MPDHLNVVFLRNLGGGHLEKILKRREHMEYKGTHKIHSRYALTCVHLLSKVINSLFISFN